MKAMVLERIGTPDDLALMDVPVPTPKAGEVLVRVQAASINDWDMGLITGTPLMNRLMVNGLLGPKVRVLGCDVAGRVEAVGDSVKTFSPGDEVYGDLSSDGFGAFAEYVRAPERSLTRKPPTMSFEQAAAVPQAGVLAVQGLIDVGKIQRGQRVLINGAGGGVGTIGLQIAKLHGAEVTVVDRADKLPMLHDLGADKGIDYQVEDFTEGDQRYDLILDVKSNRAPGAYARVLNPGGAYVTVGGDTGRLLQVALSGLFSPLLLKKRLRVVALKQNKDLEYLGRLVEDEQLRIVIDGPYPLEDLPAAFHHFASGEHKGKIVITLT